MAAGRTPLMAGNWKMNLDHLQATHLVQKLDWTLKDGKHDFGAVEVAVLPPFTDIRSVQTLIDGDRLELKYGAQDLSVARRRRLHRRDQRGVPRQARLHLRRRRPQRAARVPRRGRRASSTPRCKAAFRHGLTPIFCCGEGLEVRQAGTHVEHVLAQVEAGLEGCPRRAGRAASSSPTSRSGPSAPARSPPPRTRRRSARRSAPSSPSSTAATWPTASACSTAVR